LSVLSRGCMQGIWGNWWTHCLTRGSQYQIYANPPNANFTVCIIRLRVLQHLFCFHLRLLSLWCVFYYFWLGIIAGVQFVFMDFILTKLRNIWEHVIISNLCSSAQVTTLELLHNRYLGAVVATPSLPSTWDVLFRHSFSLVVVTFDWLRSSYFACHFADREIECVEDIFYPCRHRSRWVCYGGSNCWDRF
jgi:hypothetical protein